MRVLFSLLLITPTGTAYAQDGAPAMRSWAHLQTWVTVHDQDISDQADPASYGDPEHDPGFSIARARLGLDGSVPLGSTPTDSLDVGYALSFGLASPYDALSGSDQNLQVVDAYTRVAAPFNGHVFATSVGAQRVPFTRESLMPSSSLLFQERAVGSAWLAPDRDVGVLAAQRLQTGGDDAELVVQVGAFNGNGDLFGDLDGGMLLAGRLEWLTGKAYQSWDPDGGAAVGLGVAGRVNETAATRASGLGADVLARVAHFTLLAEVQQDTTEPTLTDVKRPAVPANTERLAYMAQLSRWIALEGVSGLEVGARFASLDDATGFDDTGDVWIAHGGVTWRDVFPAMDIGAGYIHRGEWHGPPRANDSVRMWLQIRAASR